MPDCLAADPIRRAYDEATHPAFGGQCHRFSSSLAGLAGSGASLESCWLPREPSLSMHQPAWRTAQGSWRTSSGYGVSAYVSIRVASTALKSLVLLPDVSRCRLACCTRPLEGSASSALHACICALCNRPTWRIVQQFVSGWPLQVKPTHVLNAAGLTGRPNVDWCEDHKVDDGHLSIPP